MRKVSPRQRAWFTSERWRRLASDHCRALHAKRASLPKCGARTKSTGEPCRQPAMANGRCSYHGGKTPKGDDWHRPQWPDKNRPRSMAKAMAKVRDRERAARRRAAKLAVMLPEERERDAAWHRACKPGSAAERARERMLRAQAADARARLDAPRQPPSAEVEALHRSIEDLRREIERRDGQQPPAGRPLGVFD